VISGSGSGVDSGVGVDGSEGASDETTGGASVELGAGLDSPGTVTGGPEETVAVDELIVLLGGVA
jgi:hypothetical protein